METGLRPNSAGIPYTLLLGIEAIGFPTLKLLLYTIRGHIPLFEGVRRVLPGMYSFTTWTVIRVTHSESSFWSYHVVGSGFRAGLSVTFRVASRWH